MTQENKDLLIKDLCYRLPYGVKAEYKNEKFVIEYVSPIYEDVKLDNYETWTVGVSDVRPYLFPITTLTDEQLEEFYCNFVENEINFNDFKKYYYETTSYFELLTRVSDCPYVVDWFNKNHLDYRGLIPMGLAIDATNKNIY